MKNKELLIGISILPAGLILLMGLLPVHSSSDSSAILKANDLQKGKKGELIQSNIKVIFSINPVQSDLGSNWTQPVADVYENEILVGSLQGAKRPGFSDSAAQVQIVELDQSNDSQEVLLSSFTGGAHCCGTVHVLAKNVSTQEWKEISLGPFDGGVLSAVDPLGGSNPLISTYDNRFLYRFASYAGSAAPAQLWKLENSSFMNVTHDSKYRSLHIQNLKSLEKAIYDFPYGERNPNGLLAAFVATKAILGEATSAWNYMLQRYDSKQDWGLKRCLGDYDKKGKCRQEVIYKNYPEALFSFLLESGYLSVSDEHEIRSLTF